MKKNTPPLEDRPIIIHDSKVDIEVSHEPIYPPQRREAYGKFIKKTDMTCSVCDGAIEQRTFTFNYRTRTEHLEMLACVPCSRQMTMSEYEEGGTV